MSNMIIAVWLTGASGPARSGGASPPGASHDARVASQDAAPSAPSPRRPFPPSALHRAEA